MFPAIKQALRELREGFGWDHIELGLKSASQFGFDSTLMSLDDAKYARMRMAIGGGGPSWSGETVTPASALNLSVVWACTRIISESIAFMPLSMMRQTPRGKFPANGEDVPAHPMYTALHNAPSEEMTTMGFRETLTGHCVTGGNCYSRIVRRSGTGVAFELWPLLPGQVNPDRDAQKRLVYEVKEGNSPAKTYTVERGRPHDILHVRGLGYDGIKGYSVIAMARQSLGLAQSAEKYVGKFYANGGRVPYHIEWDRKFRTDQDFDQWAADWRKAYGGPESFHLAPITEPGMKLVKDGLSPQEFQFLETRQFTIPEICRWFLMSPHMVGDLSRATFSNIEELALHFVKVTLTAWITRWEQELWRCVLTPAEKNQGYYFKHSIDGLLRGDFQTRMAGYASALQNGHLSVNEVRDLEDRNPVEGGSDYHIQLNMQALPGGTPTTSQLVKLGAKKPAANAANAANAA
jgi:HK97 family phage portal protein